MIKIYRAKKESRTRDKKRRRYILQLGKKRFHITEREVISLYGQTCDIAPDILWDRAQ